MKRKKEIVFTTLEKQGENLLAHSRKLSKADRLKLLLELQDVSLEIRKYKPENERREIQGFIKKKNESEPEFFKRVEKRVYDF